jgi:hypothetical protein
VEGIDANANERRQEKTKEEGEDDREWTTFSELCHGSIGSKGWDDPA